MSDTPSRRDRRHALAGLVLSVVALSGSGCADWRYALASTHQHNNECGHGYLQDGHPNPCPRDFAGEDAWRGPRWQNEIRMHDPWRGNRPVQETPVPWETAGALPHEREGIPSWPQPAIPGPTVR